MSPAMQTLQRYGFSANIQNNAIGMIRKMAVVTPPFQNRIGTGSKGFLPFSIESRDASLCRLLIAAVEAHVNLLGAMDVVAVTLARSFPSFARYRRINVALDRIHHIRVRHPAVIGLLIVAEEIFKPPHVVTILVARRGERGIIVLVLQRDAADEVRPVGGIVARLSGSLVPSWPFPVLG